MPDPLPSTADFFRAVITDPTAAAPLLARWDDTTQQALRAVAVQQAIIAAYQAPLTRTEVRSLVSRMRRLMDEPIDTHAVATILDSFFYPEAAAVTRRLESLPIDRMRRMMLLLPYGIASGGRTAPSASDIDTWVAETVTHFERATRYITARFGPDLGEFYRNVCIDPVKAYADLTARTDLSAQRQRAMVYNAAFAALHMMYGKDGPTPVQRDMLLADMRHCHGHVPAGALDRLLATRFSGAPDDADDDERIPVAVLLPSTVAYARRYGLLEIAAFMRVCADADHAFGDLD